MAQDHLRRISTTGAAMGAGFLAFGDLAAVGFGKKADQPVSPQKPGWLRRLWAGAYSAAGQVGKRPSVGGLAK